MPLVPPSNGPPGRVRRRRRSQPVLDLLVELRGDDDRPLHRQLYDGVRAAILAGKLSGGARIPSSRALAASLRVSRMTVAAAFDQLRAEGYLEGRRGSGTFVCGTRPDDALRARGAVAPRRAPRVAAPAAPTTPDLDAPLPHGEVVAFHPGVPALDLFPAEEWGRRVANHWRRAANSSIARELLGYGDPRGYAPLRHAIATYVTTSRGAQCTPDQVIVTAGAQQALDLVARVLSKPGDSAWLEDPGYSGVRQSLVTAGVALVPVPIDDEGLDVAAGARVEPRPRLVYVSPSHQYPLGVTMSAPRRIELLDWAVRTGAWIVEDDYDSEFRYTARPLACLQGMDVERHGAERSRVLYVGTFSKALCPALRLGYLVAPPALLDRLIASKAVADRGAPVVEQAVLADFMAEGDFARHLRRARTLYAARQRALVSAVKAHLGEWIDAAPAPAGMHLVLPLRASLARHGVTDRDIATAARERGVSAPSLSSRMMTSGAIPRAPHGALLLGYAAVDEEALAAGARVLADVIRGLLRERRYA